MLLIISNVCGFCTGSLGNDAWSAVARGGEAQRRPGQLRRQESNWSHPLDSAYREACAGLAWRGTAWARSRSGAEGQRPAGTRKASQARGGHRRCPPSRGAAGTLVA
jgi:hypothetical protein